jgi:hypothetical protein
VGLAKVKESIRKLVDLQVCPPLARYQFVY